MKDEGRRTKDGGIRTIVHEHLQLHKEAQKVSKHLAHPPKSPSLPRTTIKYLLLSTFVLVRRRCLFFGAMCRKLIAGVSEKEEN